MSFSTNFLIVENVIVTKVLVEVAIASFLQEYLLKDVHPSHRPSAMSFEPNNIEEIIAGKIGQGLLDLPSSNWQQPRQTTKHLFQFKTSYC